MISFPFLWFDHWRGWMEDIILFKHMYELWGKKNTREHRTGTFNFIIKAITQLFIFIQNIIWMPIILFTQFRKKQNFFLNYISTMSFDSFILNEINNSKPFSYLEHNSNIASILVLCLYFAPNLKAWHVNVY